MRVCLIGLGALGSNLMLAARSIPDLEWTVCDFDSVEFKNTQSQFHPQLVLRKNKAVAIKQSMQSLFKLKVDAKPVKLTGDNAEQLLSGADLVIDCLDNAASRRVLAAFCESKGTEHLHSGLAEDGSVAVINWGQDFIIDEESAEGQATCEAGEHLPMIMAASSYLALALQKYVEDHLKVGFQVLPTGVIRF